MQKLGETFQDIHMQENQNESTGLQQSPIAISKIFQFMCQTKLIL